MDNKVQRTDELGHMYAATTTGGPNPSHESPLFSSQTQYIYNGHQHSRHQQHPCQSYARGLPSRELPTEYVMDAYNNVYEYYATATGISPTLVQCGQHMVPDYPTLRHQDMMAWPVTPWEQPMYCVQPARDTAHFPGVAAIMPCSGVELQRRSRHALLSPYVQQDTTQTPYLHGFGMDFGEPFDKRSQVARLKQGLGEGIEVASRMAPQVRPQDLLWCDSTGGWPSATSTSNASSTSSTRMPRVIGKRKARGVFD